MSDPMPDDDADLHTLIAHSRHDLRTPVNAIIGYSEMLIEDAEDLPGASTFLPALQEINSLGLKLNESISKVMGEEVIQSIHAGDLPSLADSIRSALQPAAQNVAKHCEVLLGAKAGEQAEDLHEDVERISSAAKSLLDLLETPLQNQPQPSASEARKPADAAIAPITPPGNTPSTTSGQALIVDDNQNNRDMLARLLQRQNHTYAMAENGRQALDMLADSPFDLVLLDIMMPEMDGFEVLQRIKQNDDIKHIPVIMISALDEISSVVRCIEMGAEDYLPKPFDPVLLRARVGACLEQKRLRDQELDYLRQVQKVTQAAGTVESGAFQLEPLDDVAKRPDALGNLARVFVNMAREVKAREERLQKQVQQLRVEIDVSRKSKQVAEITETDYFQMLQEKAKELRGRKKN